jgi:hypothetical protein
MFVFSFVFTVKICFYGQCVFTVCQKNYFVFLAFHRSIVLTCCGEQEVCNYCEQHKLFLRKICILSTS